MPLDLIKFGMRALIKRYNENRERKIPQLDSNGEPLARTQSRAASIHESMYSSRVNFLQRAQRKYLPPLFIQISTDSISTRQDRSSRRRSASPPPSCNDSLRDKLRRLDPLSLRKLKSLFPHIPPLILVPPSHVHSSPPTSLLYTPPIPLHRSFPSLLSIFLVQTPL